MITNDEKYMVLAIKEAKLALKSGDVPVGAVLVMKDEVIAKAHNMREKYNISTYHAEVVCIQRACNKLKNWNLTGAKLYVTLEPCLMCTGAIVNSRISEVIFGAYDTKYGCCGSVYNHCSDEKLNHRALIRGGVLQKECSSIITEFFRNLRQANKLNKNIINNDND